MSIAAIYIRKSREEKDKPSHRLTVQREQLPAHAALQGWQYQIYDDGHASAARGKIEDLQARTRLEADIRAGTIHTILVIELSRLSRDDSLQDYVAWLHLCSAHRVRLATPSRILDPSQPSDWMLLLLEGGFSSVEMRTLQHRMKEGREQAYREGRFMGGTPPPPYTLDPATGNLIVNPADLSRMQRLWELATQMSAKAVAREMNLPHIFVRRSISDERLLFCQAKRIDPATGEQFSCSWAPTMTAEQAEAIRSKRINRRCGYSRPVAGALLSGKGLITCGYCDRTVRAFNRDYTDTQGRKRKYNYYGCQANETARLCERSRMIAQEEINDKLLTNMFGTLDRIRDAGWSWLAGEDTGEDKQLATLDAEEKRLQAAKQRLVAAITDEVISFADAKPKRLEIDAQLRAINDQRRALTQIRPTFDWQQLDVTREEFDTLDFADQREFLFLAIKSIKLYATYLIVEYHFPRSSEGDTITRIHLNATKK